MYSGQITVNNAAGTEKSELYLIEPPEPVSVSRSIVLPLSYWIPSRSD